MVAADPLRIVYFGTPAFAVPSLAGLLTSRHEVVAVVSQPDRPKGRGHRVQATPTKTLALEHGVPVLQPERLKDPAFLDSLTALRPDLGVVAAYGRILPESLLAVPRHGMINVHGSILPAYRGAAPVHRAVIAGEPETGVTIMRLVRELDAGPTFAERRRPIGPDETSAEVEQALAQLGADLLLEVIDQIAQGRAFEIPQDDARATFAPKITKEEGRVDWNLPAQAIHNLVRGLHPWPLAAARLGLSRLLIHRSRFEGVRPRTKPGGSSFPEPGTIVAAGPEGLSVMCGDGNVLRILEVQPEGRRVMSARDFLAGHKIAAGARLESP
jgi:methionyl-tRNA formyltransferase